VLAIMLPSTQCRACEQPDQDSSSIRHELPAGSGCQPAEYTGMEAVHIHATVLQMYARPAACPHTRQAHKCDGHTAINNPMPLYIAKAIT
jgi:hypothetical protein